MSRIRNVVVVTPIYPAEDLPKENTPVVHYFTRQWVKMGCNVVVLHYPYNFPKIIHMLIKPAPIHKFVKQFFGMATIRTTYLHETDYILEGVKVRRIPLKKCKPHGRYSKRVIGKVFKKTIEYLESIGFVPDVISSHWANPSLDLLRLFKEKYGVPVCYVDHLAGRDIIPVYKDEAQFLLQKLDLIGYRSGYIRKAFEEKFLPRCATFYCYSGIPEEFLPTETKCRSFENVTNFIYVGTLIKRKFPIEIIPALVKAFGNDCFKMSYVGKGTEIPALRKSLDRYAVNDKVELCGFLPREDVVKRLDESDVFVMISKNETFGLVYLEAMARGCITIASKREGFDGIIVDGENGFLCEAGDSEDLTSIICQIRKMPKVELQRISYNAIMTARRLTDKKVAKAYLDYLNKITCA